VRAGSRRFARGAMSGDQGRMNHNGWRPSCSRPAVGSRRHKSNRWVRGRWAVYRKRESTLFLAVLSCDGLSSSCQSAAPSTQQRLCARNWSEPQKRKSPLRTRRSATRQGQI
jgi:hypothetical protein